jgi:phage FluMu protein Com
MHISNERYFHERQRHDLALRMIHHEARTCTIRSCTGLTDDRIRRLYKTYVTEVSSAPVKRRRGKSPRQVSYFMRNVRAHFESSLLASLFAAFGLLRARGLRQRSPIEFGRLFCDAYETHLQLLKDSDISFEHAWFLLKLLNRGAELEAVRCRRCDSRYLRAHTDAYRRPCPVCKLKEFGAAAERTARVRCSIAQASSEPLCRASASGEARGGAAPAR